MKIKLDVNNVDTLTKINIDYTRTFSKDPIRVTLYKEDLEFQVSRLINMVQASVTDILNHEYFHYCMWGSGNDTNEYDLEFMYNPDNKSVNLHVRYKIMHRPIDRPSNLVSCNDIISVWYNAKSNIWHGTNKEFLEPYLGRLGLTLQMLNIPA